MRRAVILLMVGAMAFTALGSRFGYEQRCKDLALEIVKTWWENGPILPIDIERIETFEKLGCGQGFLDAANQSIINGEVEPWVTVTD